MAKKSSKRADKFKEHNRKSFTAKKQGSSSALNKNAKSSDKVERKLPGKEGFYRTKATIKRIQMYKDKGKLSDKRPDKPARVESNRKFFGNTRTIDNKKLEQLRKEYNDMNGKNNKIILKQHKIPLSLITTNTTSETKNLIEPFDKTFGPKSNRTKPKLACNSIDELAKISQEKSEGYKINQDSEYMKTADGELDGLASKFMTAGQSKRIYSELHKVIDSSDVLCQILDARDPEGTRSLYVENFIKNNCPHKHMIIIINKCDLVPTWITKNWIAFYNKLYPTVAFHASINNPFGKPALFQILKQFDTLHKEKKHISVGFIGYPNVGKSSIINTLKKQACCRAAPIPGETKVWQYVTLTKRIYLIDCPGVVPDVGDSESEKVLKGVLRIEKIEDPAEYINDILKIVKPENMQKIYGVGSWNGYEDFIGQVAVKYGKLGKGGDPDLKSTSKIILMDWQRGKIPYYVIPENFDLKQKELPSENKNENDNYGIAQNLDNIDGGEMEIDNEEA